MLASDTDYSSTAIKETIPIMDPEEDYMTIAEAEELMAKTEATRKKELDDAHAKLRGAFIIWSHS